MKTVTKTDEIKCCHEKGLKSSRRITWHKIKMKIVLQKYIIVHWYPIFNQNVNLKEKTLEIKNVRYIDETWYKNVYYMKSEWDLILFSEKTFNPLKYYEKVVFWKVFKENFHSMYRVMFMSLKYLNDQINSLLVCWFLFIEVIQPTVNKQQYTEISERGCSLSGF